MQIHEFSKRVGLSAYTLRFYEKEGLITPKRNAQGYRDYDEKDVQWIAFIQRLKATNMPLQQIKIYAKLRYQGDGTLPQRFEILENHEQNLEKDINIMLENLRALKEKKAVYGEMMAKRNVLTSKVETDDSDIIELAKQRLANIQPVKVDLDDL